MRSADAPRTQLLTMYQAALRAVHGRERVREALNRHHLDGPVYILAVGKAACAMAHGAYDALGERIDDAWVVTKHGHADPLPWPVWEAGHPLPDAASLEAGEHLLGFIERTPPHASVLMLLSGGASVLAEVLPDGVDLTAWLDINRWLLGAGLDIGACNALRKRLSLIKGGRLMRRLAPRPVLALAISDVPNDDARTIGSGPLVPDGGLSVPMAPVDLPDFVAAALRRGAPAPAPDDPCFRSMRFEIIATNADAKRAAADTARRLGYRARIEPEFVAGDARDAGRRLAQALLASDPGVVRIWGGETTVVLPARPGRGGRCQSLALAAALALRGHGNTWLLAAGTDGSDGPTEDAGALVDGTTVDRGETGGLSAAHALADADAGRFLEASGDLLQTGPTGTNVMDIMLGLKCETNGR